MNEPFVQRPAPDPMNPLQDLGRIVIPGYQPTFVFEFCFRNLLFDEGRRQFSRNMREEIENWMLGLPGDISDIEDNWQREIAKALDRSGVLKHSTNIR